MTTMRSLALAMVAWTLWQMPGRVQAEVYKCSVGGRSVYQDQPCASTTDAPHRAGTTGAGTRSDSSPPSSDPATLHKQLLEAREQAARLRALYDRDLKQAKAASMSLDQQRQLIKVLHARWEPKLQQAGRREQELTEALSRMCPGGATLNAQAPQCSK